MPYYPGIDVSLEYPSVCVVDGAGKICGSRRLRVNRRRWSPGSAGLGSGSSGSAWRLAPCRNGSYAAMRAAGLAVELLETRHVRDAFKAMPVKSDRNDARGIAYSCGCLAVTSRPRDCTSTAAEEMRASLTARKLGLVGNCHAANSVSLEVFPDQFVWIAVGRIRQKKCAPCNGFTTPSRRRTRCD